MALPNNPQTRKEMYLSNMAGQGTALPSEPHTREEEYLDYIAKNGGGGGTGEGDMTKAVYDDDLAVASAGGIADYVAGTITGKVDKVQGKGLSTNDYDDSAKAIVDNVTTALDAKQPKTLSEPIYVDGVAKFSVETAIDAVNGLAASNKSALATKATTAQIAAIQNGQNIDSFGDVETALATKVDKVTGKGLSTNDYDDTEKAKVAGAFPRSEQAVLGAKNVLPNSAVSGSYNNVSWVVNADKSVTITTNGTASGDVTIWITGSGWGYANAPKNILEKGVQYVLTDGNNDASTNTWFLAMSISQSDGTDVLDPNTAGTSGIYKPTFTVPDIDNLGYLCYIRVKSGATVNKTIKPMLRLATDPDDTYAPYAMTNRELTEIKTGTVSEYTNSYASFNTASAFLVSRAGVKQLYMFVTISTVAPNDDWIQIATLSETPTKTFTGINVPWDSALGSARSFVYQIDTSGKVYIRAKAAISSIISETFI